ncbi:MAG: flagellar biosynthetic protein FliR [Deltaproteobacteria bacterium]|nr:flagellar biosynthetic protein FliR [Deltaproteobacteria bacterium]
MAASGFVAYAIAIALVMSRVGGFMVLSPVPGAYVPQRVRAMLAVVLGLMVGLLMGPPKAELDFGLELLPLAVKEVIVGMLIGGAFRLVVIAAEFMAGLVSQASWLSAPSSLNPDLGGQTQAIGQISMMLALLLALATGVHRTVLAYLLESFRTLPVGTVTNVSGGIPPFLGLVGRSFDVGMSLALPVLGISLAVQTALALVSRVAPSLQIFNIGFAVLVGSGVVTFMASLPSISDGLLAYFQGIPSFLDELLLRMMGA